MKRFSAICVCAILVSALVGFQTAAAGPRGPKNANWPQWRGPEGSGVSAETGLPVEWSATKNVQWKTPIPGRGHSSPIVWGNRIFLTTAIEGEAVTGAKAPTHYIDGKPWSHPAAMGADRKHTLQVLAIDRDSGKILWAQTAYEGLMSDSRHAKASYASPTPVTDGKMVYAFFGTEGIYAYDFKGQLKWKAQVGKILSQSVGNGTSPVLYQNLVILQCDTEDGKESFITALNKKTGKEVWRMPRKVEISWATPILVPGGGRTELVTSGADAIIAYDPATGKELWRMKGLDSNAVPSSVAGHGLVYIFSGYPRKKVLAVRPGAAGEVKDNSNVAWSYDKGVAYVASPVLYADYLYLVSDKGILTCLDAKTGKVMYEDGRVPVPATFMASLVAYEGVILQFSEDGDTYVVKAGPKHELVRTNPLGEPIYSTPAVAAGRVFIRGAKNLYCIKQGM